MARVRKVPGRGVTNQSLSQVIHRSRHRGKQNIVQTDTQVIIECSIDNIIKGKLGNSKKPNPFRHGEYLHVSDLIGKCVRMVALSYLTDTKIIGQGISDSMGLTFAIGDSIHDYIRDKMAISNSAEMYGDWHCTCGKTRHEATLAQIQTDEACPHCKSRPTQYGELTLKNDDIKLIGSVDLTIKFDSALYFTEIKSIKHEAWQELHRPLPAHILQIMFYWWLAREAKLPIHKQVSIVYATKNFIFGDPYKEFTINPIDHLHRLDDYIEDARALKDSRAGGDLPLKQCIDISSPQAKKCEMCTVCFNL